MDRLLSDQEVFNVINRIKAIKAISSAFEGKTNREVLKQIFPNYDIVGTLMFDQYANIVFSNIDFNWLNSPYSVESIKC